MQDGLPSVSGNPGNDATASALVALCAGLLPVWSRHLAAARTQSEVAVTEMLKAFSDIGPHIDMAERQSQQINDALSQPIGGVTGLVLACEQVLEPFLNDATVPVGGRLAMQEVLAMVGRAVGMLEQIAKPFHHETQMVAKQVERMYMGFQYQDRTSQMMALLEADLSRLQQVLVTPQVEAPDMAQWLRELESQYAMAEQRHNHTGQPAGDAPAQDQETTFF